MNVRPDFFIAAILAFLTTNGYAADIRGRIVDEMNVPLPGATCKLIQLPDSTMLSATTTDAEGLFSLNDSDSADWLIEITSLGSEPLAITKSQFSTLPEVEGMATISLTQSSKSLQELVVEGDSQYLSRDKSVFIPDNKAKKMADAGISLLANMGIPTLLVNPFNNTVSTLAGDGVVMYIDYLPASSQDVANIRTADVKSVEVYEFSEDPRFNGNRHVVNFIMKKYEFGGYTKLSAGESTFYTEGNEGISSKLSVKSMTYDLSAGAGHSNNRHEYFDSSTSYAFPDTQLDVDITTLKSKITQQNYYVTGRATWESDKASVSNQVGFSTNRVPEQSTAAMRTYSPQIYPDAISATGGKSRSISLSWNNNMFFVLPHGFTLNVTPHATYSRNHNDYTFSESGTTVANLAKETAWETQLGALVQKRFGNQSVSLRPQLGIQRNDIDYSGTAQYSNSTRHTWLGLWAGLNLNYGKFWLGGEGGGYRQGYKIDGHSFHQTTCNVFFQAGYNFSRRLGLIAANEISAWSIPLNQMTSDIIIKDLVEATKGNPDLKIARYNGVILQLNYFATDKFSMSVYSRWNGLRKPATPYYEPMEIDGREMMVRQFANRGYLSKLKYGVNMSLSLFNRHLNLQSSVGYANSRLHGFAYMKSDTPDLQFSANYSLRNFYAMASWSNRAEYMQPNGLTKGKDYYVLRLGYGNANLNASVDFSNIFRSSWDMVTTVNETLNYRGIDTAYGNMMHRNIRINLTYSFGYGKVVRRGDEVNAISGVESGIVK